GSQSQTEYVGGSSLERVTITRRHHPFEGKSFAVVMPGPRQIVVRLDDGSTMRVPREWTDADGALPDGPEHVFTVDALRALGELIALLAQRSSSAEAASQSARALVIEGGEDGSA
ncbi:MAG: hypothetical protein JXP37_04600, partial [Coriobacteriia bacterium]|nr:hypothetical protein [Coriobacteriia bacterium]